MTTTDTSWPAASDHLPDAALREENQRLRALVQFGRALGAVRDLRALPGLICRQLLESTDHLVAAVILKNPNRGTLDLIEIAGCVDGASNDWQEALRDGSLPYVVDVVMRERGPVPYGDVAADPRLGGLRGPLVHAGVRRAVAYPLEAEEYDLGMILLGDDRTAPVSSEELAYLATLVEAAAHAIRHARLNAETRRELRLRDALRRVVASISSELDLDSLLARVVASAVELLDADSGTISMIDSSGAARIRAVSNFSSDLVGTVLGLGDGITGQVLATRAAVVVEHYQQDLPGPLPQLTHLRSGIAVPVWWQGQLVGVFGVFSGEPTRLFDNQDSEIMELLANHVGIAIENARLYGEVRDRLAEVTGLQAANTALVEELQPERALRTVAEQAKALSAAATVSIELLRPGGHELEVQVAVGERGADLSGVRMSVDASVSGAAVSTGRPQVIHTQASWQGGVEGQLADSLLVLPLRARGRTLGTLSAYTHNPNAFHPRQVELLATFADQAAMSLDNARVYAELQSRLEEMVGLQRLGTLLLEEHDFDQVLRSICAQLQRLTDAGGVGLALLEDDPRYLELRTVVGPSSAVLQGSRIPIEGSFAGEALRTNKPQRSDDAQNDPRGYRKSLVLGNTRTILSVPMKTRQRTVGVMSVYNKLGGGGFTDRDSDLATFFANQAAAALENARLYEQTREYAVIEERNRLARELHDSVTQSLFSVVLLSQAALSLWERDQPKARERLERANEVAQGALAEMRALIFQLRPMTLQEEGLLSALKKHVAALHSRHGLVVELRVSGAERRLPMAVEEAAFRIVQESLNNVVKHASTSSACVEVDFLPEALRICTRDEGVGFNVLNEPASGSFGMASMRERAEAAGGTLRVESAPGTGTCVYLDLPVAAGHTDDDE